MDPPRVRARTGTCTLMANHEINDEQDTVKTERKMMKGLHRVQIAFVPISHKCNGYLLETCATMGLRLFALIPTIHAGIHARVLLLTFPSGYSTVFNLVISYILIVKENDQ